MKKLLFLLLLTNLSYAQSKSDSLVIKSIKWKKTNLKNKITWKSVHLNKKELFNSNQSINILETKLSNKKILFGFASADSLTKKDKSKGKLTKTSEIALKNGAIAAVNGGFFDVKNGGSVDFIKVEGKILDTTRVKNAFHSQSAITIQNNKIEIIESNGIVGWETRLSADNVLLSGPLLLEDNQKVTLPKNAFNDNRHPRTCLCITNDSKLLLITVDGRSNQAYGMNLHELTFLTQKLNCKNAINLDGGGSTTMYIAEQPFNGVVNYPSDNKLFDHEGERSVSNIIYIKKK
jgi:exopolysaccharide biosynthesis protein